MRTAAILLLTLGLGIAAEPSRVILVSMDGFGHQSWRDPSIAGEMKSLARLAARGTIAPGMQPGFPSTTANTHLALWTGAWGDVNGIPFNSYPLLPRAAHTILERGNGFQSLGMRAEPLWVAAARQGVRTVAHQATQAYPFRDINTAPGAVVINSYQTRSYAPHGIVRAAGARFEDCAPWHASLPPSRRAPKCFSWQAGETTLHAALLARSAGYDTVRVSLHPGPAAVEARLAPAEKDPPRKRPLARHFSEALHLGNPVPAAIYFRLFEAAAGGGDFLLYHTPIQELGLHNGQAAAPEEAAALIAEAGGYFGNGPYAALRGGQFGKPLHEGGDGIAERRYLEAVELLVRQSASHQQALWRRYSPRLFITYFPIPDETDHAWMGMARDARFAALRRWAFIALDRGLDALFRLASARDHVLAVSDHGMAAVTHEVRVNRALQEAGLLSATGGRIDAGATRLLYIPYNCLLLNTSDWKQGVVTPQERPEALRQARAALERLRDPESGAPLISTFFTAEEHGERFGLGGDNGAALCFDLLPGYQAGDGLAAPTVTKFASPRGVHGFYPLREDMLAVLIGKGPRLDRVNWADRPRAIDIAPLICDLLGIRPPKDARGRSPLAPAIR